jgi:hypothetical protein
VEVRHGALAGIPCINAVRYSFTTSKAVARPFREAGVDRDIAERVLGHKIGGGWVPATAHTLGGLCLSRANTRRTPMSCHFPFPVAVGTPRAFNAFVMP